MSIGAAAKAHTDILKVGDDPHNNSQYYDRSEQQSVLTMPGEYPKSSKFTFDPKEQTKVSQEYKSSGNNQYMSFG